MPRSLTRILKSVFFRLGVYDLIRRAFPSPYPAILRFHSVSGPDRIAYASAGISLPPEAFERMIRYLSRRYRIAGMDQVEEYLRSGKALPPDTLVLTFDDGYRDNLPAARTLARHGWHATFYLTVGCLSGAAPLWLAEVRRHLLLTARDPVRLEWGGETRRHSLGTPREREQAIAAVTRWIKSLTVAERERFLGVLAREAPIEPDRPAADEVMLSWDDVRAMAYDGMSFGGHTDTHCNLVHATEDEARQELARCWQALERELGRPPRHFAYPNGGADGYYDERAKTLVRAAGFVTAVTSRSGRVQPESDPMALPRTGVTPSLADLVHELEWGKLGPARGPALGSARSARDV